MAEYDNPRPFSQPTGSTDLIVAKDNLITLDKMATSEENTVTNRKGETKQTFAGLASKANEQITSAILAVGWQILPDAWAIGVAVQNANQLVNYNGSLYRADLNDLPLTIDGASPNTDSAQWFLVYDSSELRAVATANNVAYDEVAYLSIGTVSGINYFFDTSVQLTYKSDITITGDIQAIGIESGGVITIVVDGVDRDLRLNIKKSSDVFNNDGTTSQDTHDKSLLNEAFAAANALQIADNVTQIADNVTQISNLSGNVTQENRLSFNQNWNQIGSTGDPLPSATNTTYVVGNEIASGVTVVSTNIVNATLVSGVFNASSGSYQRRYTGEFPDDYFGIRLVDGTQVQTGCALSVSGGYTFITVDMSVAPAHLFCGASEHQGIWPVLNIPSSSNFGLGFMGATYREDATFTGTDNKIIMNGIASALDLEIGDVISFDNCDPANNKPHTIESIPDDNTVIVNYEHCGDRGNGTLKLVDETVIDANIKLLSKWNVADICIGRAPVNVPKLSGVPYTNFTGRPLKITITSTYNSSRSLTIEGVEVSAGNTGTSTVRMPMEGVVPVDGVYLLSTVNIDSWVEYR